MKQSNINLKTEAGVWKKYKIVIGMDEAGRGSLAGPVTAAAVILINVKPQFKIKVLSLKNIKDSKKLTSKKREEIYEIFKVHPGVEWGVGSVGPKVIDRINIFQATKLAMVRAVRNLEKKQKTLFLRHDFVEMSSSNTCLLLDGNFKIDLPVFQKPIVKGDEKVFLISLASIIAKVTRDRAMLRWHKKYPHYCFDQHKGYGTKLHLLSLKKSGPCKIHRKSFSPVLKVQMSKTGVLDFGL